jgi:hypothetical protein
MLRTSSKPSLTSNAIPRGAYPQTIRYFFWIVFFDNLIKWDVLRDQLQHHVHRDSMIDNAWFAMANLWINGNMIIHLFVLVHIFYEINMWSRAKKFLTNVMASIISGFPWKRQGKFLTIFFKFAENRLEHRCSCSFCSLNRHFRGLNF